MGEAPKPPGPADYEPTRLLTGSLGGSGGGGWATIHVCASSWSLKHAAAQQTKKTAQTRRAAAKEALLVTHRF